MFKKVMLVVLLVVLSITILAGGVKTITVAYKEQGNNANTKWMEGAKAEFERLYPDVKVKLVKALSNEGDYNSKTALLLLTDTTIDVMLVDSFLVPAFVAAGNLSAIPVDQWCDWNTQFSGNIKEGMSINGKVYAVPISTDTRGLFYNVPLFKKAGIPVPWKPRTWNDILDAVKKLHKAGVKYPIWLNGSKAQGEATTMQTFEMLISGTRDWIYEDGKWVVKSKGFTDSLKFIQALYDMGIYDNTELALMLDANSWRILNKKMPESKEVGILLDGNWKGADWIRARPNDYYDVIKVTPMPKQYGGGYTSMSGGWTLAIPALSRKKDLAFEFIKIACNKNNLLAYSTYSGDMSPRKDVAEDKRYKDANIYRYEMSSYTEFTHFRPGDPLYPNVSVEIQSAVEAVITGQKSAVEVAEEYSKNVKEMVGYGNWIEK
ncbi:multiple sugar transport system substrate-binding protein [Marinitoga hydrogenitolerans DSM 16785]|uniref:Multiple sugar transport system substrate-binding protein n=1 Tax=Marinitoga hydrogenitolerans (strain DSM 16785 / JCM 12826 / AT1271) TaxID=1122195 RepID=A0A1M4ZLT8_MARH1|nr:extracellular solute-binding protein [Marinitoga hydrogenitolerans]SHF19050.1 multiple sugar transport system substrate-binding protein [Marinitoga hydrogenitolerans DSM 16785]